MAVRNFYVEADIEGRETMFGGGPRNKEGGMTTNIYQRDDGGIVQVLKVVSREYNGKLTTEVFDKDGNKFILMKVRDNCMELEALLKRLIRNRNKDDLHSAMCYFKSGRVAYICARFDKSLSVVLRDEDITVDCPTVAGVLNVFGRDELVRYEI